MNGLDRNGNPDKFHWLASDLPQGIHKLLRLKTARWPEGEKAGVVPVKLIGLSGGLVCVAVDYLSDETIIVETWPNSEYDKISKKDVVKMSLSGELFPPKTSRHIFSYDVPPIFISLEALR